MSSTKLAEFRARRARYGALPKGTAPVISSSDFRVDGERENSSVVAVEHRLSREAQARKQSTLKASTKVYDPSFMISLGTARPASVYFPWHSISISAEKAVPGKVGCEISRDSISVECMRGEDAYDLDIAMNYGFAAGSPQLLRFITEHVELMHDPPYRNWSTALTCGTTSALDIVLRILCDRGDTVVAEAYTYPGMMEAARPLGFSVVGVGMDEGGLDSEALDEMLTRWDSANSPKSKVLYTIPSGQNPTGITQTMERRQAIYSVAQKHDMLILEDDPYSFLQLGGHHGTWEEYLGRVPPSYLSLDVSGRVIRLDSTSKILAPGLRCGWITACSEFVEKFLSFTEFSTTSPSGPSQIMLYKLLDESWGHEGFLQWLLQLSERYGRCRDTLVGACMAYLPKDLCKWTVPESGMFLWIEIDWRLHSASHPILRITERSDTVSEMEHRIFVNSRSHGVQVSKGSWFSVDSAPSRNLAFRLTFAAASENSLVEAVRRFSRAICEEFL